MGELRVSFCAVFVHNSLMSILQDIFKDYYEEMIYTLHPRPAVIENVDKMLGCGDPSFSGAMSPIVTACSPLMKISVISSYVTVLCSTASFMQ